MDSRLRGNDSLSVIDSLPVVDSHPGIDSLPVIDSVPVIPAKAGIQGAVSNLQIFSACVAIWGSTWLAITFQLGRVAPEASVSYRFLLASVLLFAWCRARGLSLAYGARERSEERRVGKESRL